LSAAAAADDLAGEFAARLEVLHGGRGYPGGVVAGYALPDGRVGLAATGVADVGAAAPMTVETRSMSGSIGKMFVSAVALSLVRDGTLDLDTRISTWLGDEPWLPRLPNAEDITLRMLLAHRSGIPDHVALWRFNLAVFRRWAFGDPSVPFTPEEQIAFVLDREPLFAAGKGFHYTDTGYLLIGLIVERATGRAYHDLLRERILEPLALSRTEPSDRLRYEGLANGAFKLLPLLPAVSTLNEGAFRVHPGNEWTGGGLVTHPGDLVRWVRGLFEGRVLDQSYVETMLGSPSVVEEDLGYGLGVYIYQTPLGPAWGHGGWFPGYTARVLYFPEVRVAVAIQANGDRGVPLGEWSIELARTVIDAASVQR
jgi:D-alanyl-D-alanine carboxypeptidase